jgi:outer membrane protein OmpA-like peptidoglycan-associated protein
MRSTVAFAMFVSICLSPRPAAAEDELQDCPYFSGMPSYAVTDAEDKEFDAFAFCVGTGMVPQEGKVWSKFYTLEERGKAASELQILRNYGAAIKKMGGTIVYEGDGGDACDHVCARILTAKIAREGAKDLWVSVRPCNGGDEYWLVVLEVQAMKQDVAAADLYTTLEKEGHVALYINFDFAKATIKPDSIPTLDEVAKMMSDNADLKLSVEGHTDNVGKAKANRALSEERAKSVVAALVKRGVDAKRLQAVGHGHTKPIADNTTEEGRAKNRRVELVKR